MNQPKFTLYKIPFIKKLFLFLKKGILVFRKIKEYDDSSDHFDYNCINRLTRIKHEIVTHVYSNGDDFAVYKTFESAEIIASANEKTLANLNKVSTEICALKYDLNKRELKRFHRRFANAIRMGLLGQKTEALFITKDIRKKVDFLRVIRFRLVYLLGAIIVASTILILNIGYEAFELTFGTSWDELQLLRIMLFAAIGGVFSVSLSYNSLKTKTPEAGAFFYCINGMSRIMISMFAGIVAYQFMMAGFLFSTFKESIYGILCISILAGFTETFIPKLLQTQTKQLGKNANK